MKTDKTVNRADQITDRDFHVLRKMRDGRVYGPGYLPWPGPNGLRPSEIERLVRLGYVAKVISTPQCCGYVKVKDPSDRITEAELAEVRRWDRGHRVLHHWRMGDMLMIVAKPPRPGAFLWFYTLTSDGIRVSSVNEGFST